MPTNHDELIKIAVDYCMGFGFAGEPEKAAFRIHGIANHPPEQAILTFTKQAKPWA